MLGKLPRSLAVLAGLLVLAPIAGAVAITPPPMNSSVDNRCTAMIEAGLVVGELADTRSSVLGSHVSLPGQGKVLRETNRYLVYAKPPNGTLVQVTSCNVFKYTSLKQTPEFQEFHRSRAESSDLVSTVANDIALASGFTSVLGFANTLLDLLVSQNGPWTAAFVSAVGLGVSLYAAFAASSLFWATIAAVQIVGAFASYMSGTHAELAADPPDPNYQEIFEYTDAAYNFDFGLAPGANDYLNSTFTSLGRLSENLTATLTTQERYQGAVLGGDADAAHRQLVRLNELGFDYGVMASDAGDYLLGLPRILDGVGFTDVGSGDVTAYSMLRDYGLQLGGEAVPDPNPVPEPGTLALLGLGLAGLGLSRRRRVN